MRQLKTFDKINKDECPHNLVCVFLTSVASAQINPISRVSEISESDGLSGVPGSFSGRQIESTSFATFDESLSGALIFSPIASQFSTFDSTTVSVSTALSGIGTSSFGSDFAGTFGSRSASSTFELIFSLAEPSEFSITGTLSENDPVEFVSVDTGSAFFDLEGPVSLLLESNAFTGPTTIDQTVILTPGVYTLEIGSSGAGNQIEPVADSSAQITFEFTGVAVPEPSSLVVLLACAMPMATCRRRRRV